LAILAVLSIGLGIGTVTSMYSTALAFSFRPLPQVRDPGRLMHVWEGTAQDPGRFDDISAGALRDLAELHEFVQIGAWRMWSANITGTDIPERVTAARVTSGFLRTVGRAPFLGRDFTVADDAPGANRVALVTYGLWQRRFGGDGGLVGRTVHINGEAHEVIGILPKDFLFPPGAQLLVPLGLGGDDWAARRDRSLFALARLAPGAGHLRAAAAASALGQRLAVTYPESNDGWVLRAEPAERYFGQGARPFMMVLLASGAFVLLIACGNVANLLLARAVGSRRELAVRVALGASRGRVVRQLLMESVLLGLAGGALGALLAWWGLKALSTSVPGELRAFISGITQFRMDRHALAFSAVVAVGSGILFGVVPALAAARVDVQGSLKEGARGEVGGARAGRLRAGLVVAEVALALLALVGATQTLDSYRRLALSDPGFKSRGVLTFVVTLPPADYPDDSAVVQFYQRLEDRIAALPGVERVASTTILPLSPMERRAGFEVEGRPLRRREDAPRLGLRLASPGYLEALAIPLVRGRLFTSADRMGAPPIAVVSEAAARLLWPGEDPLGKRFRPDTNQWVEVVGIVRNVRGNLLAGGDVSAVAYLSNLQRPARTLTFVVAGGGDGSALARPTLEAVNAVDPRLAAGDVVPMSRMIVITLSPYGATARTLAVSALVALIMACVGVYGVMAYSVSQRTQEMGVRVALGATPDGVRRLVLGQALALTGIGIAFGVVGALAMSQGLQAILVESRAADPLVLVGVALLLAVATLAASWLPARRATRVDPMLALRAE
jgi:putative ABC transport system permease protein